MRTALAALGALCCVVGLRAQAEVERGLSVTFSNEEGLDARVARLAAVHVPDGKPPTPFLAPGPFTATFRGWLEVARRDRYTFTVAGTGSAEVLVAGKAVELGSAKRLKKGRHELEVRYLSPPSGDAVLRLLWSGTEFIAEPLPPTALWHDPADEALRLGTARRQGRELVATRQCTKCHQPPSALVLRDGSMPELAHDAPALDAVGARLTERYLAGKIGNPHVPRGHARMPRLVRGENCGQDAADMASYLATLGEPGPTLAADAALEQRGGELFGELGCAGCHTMPSLAPDPERISLRFVGAKWHDHALVGFLQKPTRFYAWHRMPDFALTEDEARALAAFLKVGGQPLADLGYPEGDAERGRGLVSTMGCAKCHFVGEVGQYRAPKWVELADFTRGCLADEETDRGEAPWYDFDAGQRAALRQLGSDLSSLARTVPAEFAERQIEARSCSACHARDGELAVLSTIGDEVEPLLDDVDPPMLAQNRPALTDAGAKLRDDWITRLLRGQVDPRPRPWLRQRMPASDLHADLVGKGLAAQHGYGAAPAVGSPDPELAPIGAKLTGPVGGFACTLCHGVGDTEPTGVFEAQGINFAYTAERLREDWFHRWMWNPLRIAPASRMPRYANAEGKTGFVDVLGGDARQQFEAMWEWLKAGRGL